MAMEFKHGQAFQHMEKGQHLEQMGRMDEAMLEFKRAVEADPSVAAAHTSLGQHYQRKGLLTKATDEFRSAALLNADYESWFNLGRALSDLEQYEQAADAFRMCLASDAQDPTARYELAFVQCALGMFAEGLQGFQSLANEYPDDWELELAVANCYIGMNDYVAAERTLRQALTNAPTAADKTPVREALWLTLRYLEFPAQSELEVKEHFYAEYGVACLGSGHDHGIGVPVYESYGFTYRDIATTLHRLLLFLREYNWQPTAIVSVNRDAMPMALALAQLLRAPVVPVDELRDDDLVLVVMGANTLPELCEVMLEHMPGQHLSFALALAQNPDPAALTDFCGVACLGECTLPWKRLAKRSPEAAATSILRALAALPDEDNQAQQLNYYVEQHKLLRFFDVPTEAGLVHGSESQEEKSIADPELTPAS